jgi:hypothetical protein
MKDGRNKQVAVIFCEQQPSFIIIIIIIYLYLYIRTVKVTLINNDAEKGKASRRLSQGWDWDADDAATTSTL